MDKNWDELLRVISFLAGQLEGYDECLCTPASAERARLVIALMRPLISCPTVYSDGDGGLVFHWDTGIDHQTFLIVDETALHAFHKVGREIVVQLDDVPFDGVTLDSKVMDFLPKRQVEAA